MQEENLSDAEEDVYSLLNIKNQELSFQKLSVSHHSEGDILVEPPSDLLNQFLDSCPLQLHHSVSKRETDTNLTTLHSHKKYKSRESKYQRKSKPKRKSLFKIDNNSPFHNCQKHLIVALKNLIVFPENIDNFLYKQVAYKIWTIFINGCAKAKKILHFIFNQYSQRELQTQELRNFGLFGILEEHGLEVFNRAKQYLRQLTSESLCFKNIEKYVENSKIRNKQTFCEYLMSFKEELEKGYLNRRLLIKEK